MEMKIIAGATAIVVVIASVVIFAGCVEKEGGPLSTPSPSPTEPTPTNTIIIKNLAFNPSTLTIKVGTTVTWINEDSAPHKIKSDTFSSNNLNKGDTFQFKFDNAGSYDYICEIHSYMKGKIIVVE